MNPVTTEQEAFAAALACATPAERDTALRQRVEALLIPVRVQDESFESRRLSGN